MIKNKMKKVFLFLLVLFLPLAGRASNRYLGTVYDYCYGANRTVYDLGSNYSAYGAVPDHTIFFEPFPYTNTICLWTGYYNWHGRTTSLCSGYSTTYMNQANKTNQCNRSSGCWYWTCNSGYRMETGGNCVINETLEQQCARQGLTAVNNVCMNAQERCSYMGLRWANGVCQSAQETCIENGMVWYNNQCMTQGERCAVQSKYWINNQCLSLEQYCAAQNKVIRNNQCALPFCNGFGSFATASHMEYSTNSTASTCTEYRCKQGGFTSATNHTCITNKAYNVADISTSRNGYYVNNDSDVGNCKAGVLCQCPADQYVSKQGNIYACRDLEVRQAPAFNNCWQCTSKPALTSCLMNGSGC